MQRKILDSAANLIASKGFHSASMSEIGNEVGITGSAIYRHFDSKSAILVALFERAIDSLLKQEQTIVETNTDLPLSLRQLIDGQVSFVIDWRAVAQVYHNEINNLPETDKVRLKRKQRLYLEEWVHLLKELRPDLDDAEARAIVHAAIGAIQSTLFHNLGLADDKLRSILTEAALSVLGLDKMSERYTSDARANYGSD